MTNPRIDKIVLPDSLYNSPGSDNEEARIQAVVEFVNALVNEGHWNFDEVPEAARTAYFADCLMTEVCNFGFGQFFFNTGGRFNTMVELALKALGADRYLEVFKAALKRYESNGSKHTTEARSGYQAFTDRFMKLHEQQSLRAMSSEHLAAQADSLSVVADDDYETFIEQMTVAHPGYDDRLTRVKPELDQLEAQAEHMSSWEEAAATFCQDNELHYAGANGFGPTDIDDGTYETLFFTGIAKDSEDAFLFGLYREAKSDQMVLIDGESFEELTRL